MNSKKQLQRRKRIRTTFINNPYWTITGRQKDFPPFFLTNVSVRPSSFSFTATQSFDPPPAVYRVVMEEEVHDVAWGTNLLSDKNLNDEPAPQLRLSDWAGSISLTEWFEHEKPQRVHKPNWLELVSAEECQDALRGLVFPSINDGDNEVKLVQKTLIAYVTKLCKRASRRAEVRDTHSTALLRPTPASRKPTVKPDGALFASRKAPTNGAHVVAVFDFKKGTDSFSKADVAQVLTYCQRILAVEQPDRHEASGFLLNGASVAFVRVARSSTSGKPPRYEYQFTPPLSVVQGEGGSTALPTGIRWLYSFFATGSHRLGFDVVNNPFDATFVHSTLLGHGVSSRVYSVLDNDDKVIKLYYKDEANHEAGVLTRLAQEDVPNVPQLVEADTDMNMGLVLSPRATDLRLGQFALRHALQALDTLQAVHEKTGLVHRDIRPANLLLQDNGDILVNDWGFAVPANEPHPYGGAFVHASDTVLGHIAEGKTTFAVGPADDLVSLVRTTLVLNFPRAAVAIEGVNKAEYPPVLARRLIDGWKSWLPRKWVKLQDLAEKCDYDGVRRGLEKLIPQP